MIDVSPLSISPHIRFQNKTSARLAYGCWRMAEGDQDTIRAKLDAVLSAGIGILDTAAIYGWGDARAVDNGFGLAETMLGQALKDSPGLRKQFQIVTKGGITPPLPYNSSKSHLIASCEASLTRLQTEQIDLFLIHRPDLLTSHFEAAEALDELVQSGKVKSVGVSNYTLEQTRALQSVMKSPLEAIQPEISAFHTSSLDDGSLDHAMVSRQLVMAWSPLAGGALATGLPPRSADKNFDNLIKELDRQAKQQDTTRDAIALAWVLAHPANILPLIGTQKPERITSAMRAFDVQMTRRDWYAILEASRGQPMP